MATIVSKRTWTGRLTGSQLVGAILVLEGFSVFGLRLASLATGSFSEGVLRYQDRNYPVLHVAAESLMGALALTGGIGLLMHRAWSRPVAYLAFGALAYSSVNSAGWPIQNNPGLLAPMVLTLVASLICVPYVLLRGRV